VNINYFREWISLYEQKNSNSPPLPLKRGDKGPGKGDWIVKVQKRLGIEPASGLFLDKTEAAVRQYQRKNGIRVTGQVGVITWNSLFPNQKVDEKNPNNKNEKETKPSTNTILTGIDISHNNESISWAKAKKGLSFVYIRASMGDDRTDTKFVQNYNNCIRNRIPWGAYHFYTFDENSDKQIKNITSKVPKSFNLPIALDVEYSRRGPNAFLQNRLRSPFIHGLAAGRSMGKKSKNPNYKNVDHARKQIFHILKGLENHYGKKPIIYCTINFFEEIIEGYKPLDSYKLWIAAVSKTWQEVSNIVGPNRLVCHQIKGDHEGAPVGRWSGIEGLVDINKAHGKFW